MPAPKTTLSSLQGIEDRLRRLYATAGSFGVSWEPNISLQVDAGDLTGPGCNLFRGRRFIYTSAPNTLGAAGMQAFSFQVPSIIEKVWVNGNNASVNWRIEVRGPADGLVATATRGVVFTELYSPSVQSDYAPVYLSALVAATGGGADLLWQNSMQLTGQTFDVQWFLPGQLPDQVPGNYHQLVFRTGAATTNPFPWGFAGRLF